jgi:hypothetical protein
MTDPTLTCPSCRTEIKLTESLAAPLIADTRRRYETQLAQKEAEVAAREAAVREQREELATARQEIEAEVATKLDQERGKIAVAEALKAKRPIWRPGQRKSPTSMKYSGNGTRSWPKPSRRKLT